jgi:pimeloyl-ACP methyl ester carboxylesterase
MNLFDKSFVRLSLVILTLTGITLAACSRTQETAGLGVTPSNPTSRSGSAASRGSSLHLAGGAGVTILSPSLGRRGLVSVAYDPRGTVAAPDAWSIVPGTLRVAFDPALRETTSNEPGLRVTIPYPPSRATEIRAGNLLIVAVDYANGRNVKWVARSNDDAAHDRLTTDLPASLLSAALNVTIAVGVDSLSKPTEPPGPRYWDGTKWSKTGKIAANQDTVVLIHGIFSSVENSFPKTCPSQIATAGGFGQVLGWDYAWNEPPSSQGKLFAGFLKTVANAKVKSLTVEGHSYGSVVTLAAIPKLDTKLKVSNVVTLGGPLPLRGTPLALPDNHWRMGMVLGLMDWYFDQPPSVVDRAYKSGMVASMATNSAALKTVLNDINAMPAKPKFVQVAGTKWICFLAYGSTCIISEEEFKPQLIDGSGVKLPWDGVVETIAAESTDLPSPVPKEFDLSHIDLQCSTDVIDWVGKQLTASR